MTTVSDIIGKWPTQKLFATDIDVPETTASSWKQRHSIPAKYHAAIVVSAKARKLKGITYEALAKASMKQAA